MIARNATPVSNRPVYKRIEIGSRAPEKPAITITPSEGDKLLHKTRMMEADRIWRHVVHAAQGSAAPLPEAEPPVIVDWNDFCF